MDQWNANFYEAISQPWFYKFLLATLDTLEEAVVGRLLLQVLVPKESSTLAGEDTGDPAECVRDAPDSHANTPLDRETALGDRLVCLGLGTKLRGRGGSVHANVNFGVDNVDVQRCETAKNSLKY